MRCRGGRRCTGWRPPWDRRKTRPLSPGNSLRIPAALSATADDFGHVIHRTPQYVLKPASVADISAVGTWAASQGLKVAARGQGHSN